MPARRPQINFQVDPSMKRLYEEAKTYGHWVTRFCTAGFLLMIADPQARLRAMELLREWEADYEKASPDQIRRFVLGAEDALRAASRGSRPARRARAARKAARRAGSA